MEKNKYYNKYKIVKIHDYYTIEFYYDETKEILKKIKSCPKGSTLLNKSNNTKLSNEQKEIIEHCFDTSRISLINGSAGTGKTTIIKEIIENNPQLSFLCLTITNTALNSLKIERENVFYNNIKTFENKINNLNSNFYNVIIIDEASFVPTNSMYKILMKFNENNILIVGDTEQIESIEFGNWFKLAIELCKDYKYVHSLTYTYRNELRELKTIWDEVRNQHSRKLLELLNAFNMSSKLTNDVFENKNNEIVLCLNYDGLYGINNVNRYLQAKNPNQSYLYQQNVYKVNDPIVFVVNEYEYLGIYNNLKGKIIDIIDDEVEIKFLIEIDKKLKKLFSNDITIVKVKNNKTIVSINKKKDYSEQDETDVMLKTKLTFQVSYAMSIHKAQGLEFDNVKIIITKESDEQINKNIFYTAITRAKKNLKIYWEPEVANEVSDILSENEINDKRDIKILENELKSI